MDTPSPSDFEALFHPPTEPRAPSSDAQLLYWMDERLGPQGSTGRRDKVLLVAERHHPEGDRVTLRLHQLGVPVCRLYPGELRQVGRLEISSAEDIPSRFVVPLWDLPLDEIAAVWLCEPLPLGQPAWDAGLRTLLGLLDDAAWVNRLPALLAAQNAIEAIRAASCAGLQVPRALLTNEPAQARDFYRAYNGAVRVRSLLSGKILGQLTVDHLSRLDYLHHAPCLFEQIVQCDAEVLVAAVGRRLFAGIQPAGTAIGPFASFSMPSKVARACRSILDHSALGAATIGLRVDHAGAFWFDHLDPCGTWLPLQEQAGLPVAQAMADLLAGDLSIRQ